MIVILLLTFGFVLFGVAEYTLHLRRLGTIPYRIQVNGTRGKSSLTRLIAAGLRAGGLRVVAKVTGTKPRFITGDQEEYPVRRLGRANIAEEIRIVRLASEFGAQVLVIECMALVPQYQYIESHLLIRPTHGVITNVRADHLDVMGPTVFDVAKALSNTIPTRGSFFTAERGRLGRWLTEKAGKSVQTVVSDPESVSDDEMAGFNYVEHKENVALALTVCAAFGIERKLALAGMYRSLPDPGAMRIYQIRTSLGSFELVNTLAANDPDSIRKLWSMVSGRAARRLVLVNCRSDRIDRSRQLAELVREFPAVAYVATGGMTKVFLRRAAEIGISAEQLIDLGNERDPAEVFDKVCEFVRGETLVFATGNTVGYGERLISYFASRSMEKELQLSGY